MTREKKEGTAKVTGKIEIGRHRAVVREISAKKDAEKKGSKR